MHFVRDSEGPFASPPGSPLASMPRLPNPHRRPRKAPPKAHFLAMTQAKRQTIRSPTLRMDSPRCAFSTASTSSTVGGSFHCSEPRCSLSSNLILTMSRSLNRSTDSSTPSSLVRKMPAAPSADVHSGGYAGTRPLPGFLFRSRILICSSLLAPPLPSSPGGRRTSTLPPQNATGWQGRMGLNRSSRA